MSFGAIWRTAVVFVGGLIAYLAAEVLLGDSLSADDVVRGALVIAFVIVGLWLMNRRRGSGSS